MATLYLFIVLKIGPEHNLYQKMSLETICSEATYASARFAGLPGATCGLQSMMSHSTHTTHTQKTGESDQTLSFTIVQ